MCLLQGPGYQQRDKREPLPYWRDVQADLSIFWSHIFISLLLCFAARVLYSGFIEVKIRFSPNQNAQNKYYPIELETVKAGLS